jgi:hypothetical protein
LLSGEELLEIAGEDLKKRENRVRGLAFALLDLFMIVFCFLPLFAERGVDTVKAVALIAMDGISTCVKIAYFVTVIGITLIGIVALVLQNFEVPFWAKHKYKFSLCLGIAATGLFIVTLQPYASLFSFVFLAIKVFLLIKIK